MVVIWQEVAAAAGGFSLGRIILWAKSLRERLRVQRRLANWTMINRY